MVSHPRDRRKSQGWGTERMTPRSQKRDLGHPVRDGLPPSRQKKIARMGHGADDSQVSKARPGAPSSWWSPTLATEENRKDGARSGRLPGLKSETWGTQFVVVSHPRDRRKSQGWGTERKTPRSQKRDLGHPVRGGLPPSRQKKIASMGHGADDSQVSKARPGAPSSWWSPA